MPIIETMLARYRFDLICSCGIAALALIAILLFFLLRRRIRLDRSLLLVPVITLCTGIFFTGLAVDDYLVFRNASRTPQLMTTTADLQQIFTSDSSMRFTPQLLHQANVSQLNETNNMIFTPVSGEPETLELHVLTDNLEHHLGSAFELHHGQRFSITYEAQSLSLISISPVYSSAN